MSSFILPPPPSAPSGGPCGHGAGTVAEERAVPLGHDFPAPIKVGSPTATGSDLSMIFVEVIEEILKGRGNSLPLASSRST